MDLEEMYSRSVEVGECLVWSGVNAVYNGANTTTTVHRKAYELVHGSVPDGFRVKHTCKRVGCIRDEHLVLHKIRPRKEPTHAIIFRDNLKLTPEIVEKIRRECRFGVIPKYVASIFSIDPATVRAIARGEIWKPLP